MHTRHLRLTLESTRSRQEVKTFPLTQSRAAEKYFNDYIEQVNQTAEQQAHSLQNRRYDPQEGEIIELETSRIELVFADGVQEISRFPDLKQESIPKSMAEMAARQHDLVNRWSVGDFRQDDPRALTYEEADARSAGMKTKTNVSRSLDASTPSVGPRPRQLSQPIQAPAAARPSTARSR